MPLSAGPYRPDPNIFIVQYLNPEEIPGALEKLQAKGYNATPLDDSEQPVHIEIELIDDHKVALRQGDVFMEFGGDAWHFQHDQENGSPILTRTVVSDRGRF